MKGGKPKEGLLTENEFFNETDLDEEARKRFETDGWLKPERGSNGEKFYSSEDVEVGKELGKAMKKAVEAGLSRSDAHDEVTRGMASKRRRGEADSSPLQFIDPREVKTHPKFKGLLSIEEDLAESLVLHMSVEGYYRSVPLVLAIWPGQEEPVLIDGHTRLRAAIQAGVTKIPYMVETFDGIDGALEYVAKVQTQRRPTDDWVLYQLITELDSLMERGGDRRSEQARSNTSQGESETPRLTSAQRVGAKVGCSPRTVERARRIRKHGTAEILQAMKNREMTISQAEQAIANKDKPRNNTETEPSVEENKNPLVQVNEEYREVLSQVDGTLHEHVNKAVRMYIRWLRDKGRLPIKEQPDE